MSMVLLAVTLLTAGLAADGSKDGESAPAVHKAHAEFIAAFNAGDVERAFVYLTDDFVALVERQPTMDKTEYRALVTPFLAANKASFSFEVDETIVSGDWAFERIRYSGTVTAKAGGPARRVSWRAIAIWKRLDAGWRVARYIRTPDPEPPAAK